MMGYKIHTTQRQTIDFTMETVVPEHSVALAFPPALLVNKKEKKV